MPISKRAGGAALAFCLSGPLMAQQLPEVGEGSDIIVTATRRADTLLKVPVSVSAVPAVTLERIGAKNLEDLARSVPGLMVEQRNEQSDKNFVIRGIGSDAQSATVAVYLDDTPITFGSSSPDLKLFDVAQIEVLRGPQGTLFGSSSMGGAIRYTSARPQTDAWSGMVRAEGSMLSHGAASYEGQGVISGPLSAGKVGFRASGFYRHEGGYIDLRDDATGALVDKNIGTQKSYGGRFALLAQISPTIDATLSTIFQKNDQGRPSTLFSGRGVTSTVGLPSRSRVARAGAGRLDKVFLPNLTVNADLGVATLTSSSSYLRRDFTVRADFTYLIQRALGLPDPTTFTSQSIERRRFRAYVQELRLASQGDGPFKWIIGGYFRDTHEERPQSVPSNLGQVVPPLAGALLPNGSLFERTVATNRTQYALFGEASYRLFDALTLTAGVRWTELRQRLDREADGLLNGGFSEVHLRSKERPVTPKFSAQYQFSPRAMVYTTIAKGFREGGPNSPVPIGVPACATALRNLGRTDTPQSFDTDSVWSYEVGTKFETSDRRLRVVTSAYHIDWSGIQESINLSGGCGFSYIDNIGKARSRGFELETTVRPGDGFTVDFAAGYTNAKLTRDLVSGATAAGPVVAAPKGTKLPNVPDWTFRVAPQVEFDVTDDWQAFARGELQYVGNVKRHLNTPSDDPRTLNRADYFLVNLRLGVTKGDNEVNLFVNNLFDDATLLYKDYGGFAPGSAYEAIQVRPRVIGLSFKRNL